jgi:OmpA-OmpF porin, OOP family
MNKKKIIIGLATITLLCGSLPSYAGLYAGGGVGYFRINDQDFLNEDEDLRDNRDAWKAFFGININDVLGFEVSHVDFGDSSDGSASLEASGHTFAATLGFPVGDSSSLYLKAGKLYWDMNASIADIISVSDDGDDSFVGIGMRFGGNPGLGLKIEYEQYAIGDTDIDMPSVSLNVGF